MNPKGNPENLTPFPPGNNANPTGINQYTYRTRAEQDLEDWCVEHGREMVRVIADAARAGKPWAAKLILDRVLPAVQKHEVEIPGADPAGLFDALAAVAKSKRANGHDRDADTGANGRGS